MLSLLLYPFSVLYHGVTSLRNVLFDKGLIRSVTFEKAVICVGNLSVGGTGKTPMIEYLVNLLGDRYSVAILSRGYGRATSGYRIAGNQENASTLGDEPFQFYKKFGSKVSVAVCESRVVGISRLLAENPSVNVILLDDAFQHRAVRPLFSILLTDYAKPFFSDFLLPRGRLRESRSGSRRADVVVVTKCNSLPETIASQFQDSIQQEAGPKPVFFSGIRYREPVPFGNGVMGKNVVLVSGIANSATLVDYVSKTFHLVDHVQFGDHHPYSKSEVQNIESKASTLAAVILTTEKDMVKLISPTLNDAMNKKLWFYLPIETYFLKSGLEFDKQITGKIENHFTTHFFKR
jgi:tetraacyldisaccharide 4'-kinase